MPSSPLLLHMHLPKTAGITLFDMLDLKYGFRRGLVALNHYAEITPIVSRQAEIQAVSGHFPYGIDALFDRPCVYIVLLRDPVDRVISNFHYIRREENHPQQTQFAAMSLDEFARSSDLDLDNAQTRRLLPGDVDDPEFWRNWPAQIPFGAIGPEHLERAKSVLDKCGVVGTSERFNDTLSLARSRLLPDLPTEFISYNVGIRPKIDEVSAETKALLAERNRFDTELHRHADTLLSQRLAESARAV